MSLRLKLILMQALSCRNRSSLRLTRSGDWKVGEIIADPQVDWSYGFCFTPCSFTLDSLNCSNRLLEARFSLLKSQQLQLGSVQSLLFLVILRLFRKWSPFLSILRIQLQRQYYYHHITITIHHQQSQKMKQSRLCWPCQFGGNGIVIIIIFETMLSCLIYLALTLILPIRQTFASLKSTEGANARLWSTYWAFYCLILLIKSVFTFLTYQPFEFAILLFHLWLYLEEYRGALFLSDLIVKKLEEFKLDVHVKQVGERLSFLNVLEEGERVPAKED